jgi:hypothetical protein
MLWALPRDSKAARKVDETVFLTGGSKAV